ncbi:hypothetical protein ACJIZ3_008124 [Penstemon smallii]|uniref:TF-B3 domain-containing protein n=1 Tax=Penstemon smallii TaxID=265156 RepID=A0ABD3TAV0_9LAMI
MARKPKIRPSFFKVLISNFSHRLKLPPSFVKKHREILPENAKLRTSSGEMWDIRLEQIEDGRYCFTRGWKKFRKDLGLKIGEFVVFWFNNGESTFDVSVLGINGCEREKLCSNSRVELDPDYVVDLNKDCTCMNPVSCNEVAGTSSVTLWNNPRMEIVLKQSRKYRVSLRKDFAEAARLIGKRAVVLEYEPKQHYGAVILDSQKSLSQFRLDLGAGWNDFRKTNELVNGETYLLEFNPRKNVIQVKELNK